MKRFHVNVSVADIDASVQFYNQLFSHEPTVLKPEYAKWMLEDPKINFSITTHGTQKGVDHLGLQSDTEEEFQALRARLHEAELASFEQPDVVCCYARSSKSWVRDPDSVAWETFVSVGESSVYDNGTESTSLRTANSNALSQNNQEPAQTTKNCCA